MLFASEITALVDGLSQRPEINLGAVEAFLRYRYVPGNVSVYKGVEKLPPGHLLTFEPERNVPPVIASYWAPQYKADKRLETGAALELLDTLLVEAVEQRMESDVPLAALLSGGLDSSLIVAIAAQKLGVRWKTIHASFTDDREGESYYANLVAQVCQTEHEEIEISPGKRTGCREC